MAQPLIFEAIMGWTTRSSSWGADPHLTKRLKIEKIEKIGLVKWEFEP
jgi:hypothetical protein